MFKILIVDDEYPARQLMRMMIDALPDYSVIGEAEDGQQALELYHSLRPDILLTDIEMPVMNGLELIETIKAEDPGQPVIILSCYESFSYAQRAMRSGVRSYLIKDLTRREDMEKCLNETIEHTRLFRPETSNDTTESDTFSKLKRISPADSERIASALEQLFGSFFKQDPERCQSLIRWFYHLNLSGILQYRFLQYINLTLADWIKREMEDYNLNPSEVFPDGSAGLSLEKCGSSSEMYHLICGWMTEWMRIADERCPVSERTRDILNYIVDHHAEELTLEGVAEHFYIHPVHLSRTIKNETNITFSATVNKIRIERAKLLLAFSSRRISDIACAVGFQSSQGFYNAFKKQTGLSPADYARSI